MATPSDAADAYLTSRFNTGLEQVLLDLIDGYPSPARTALTGVDAECFDTRRHPDGSVSEGYAGRLVLQGVAYSWRAWIYRDIGGARFLSDLSEFSPLDWRAAIRVAG
jgi:hypothetical protein